MRDRFASFGGFGALGYGSALRALSGFLPRISGAIGGRAIIGTVVTVTIDAQTPTGAIQWIADGTPISGANAAAYTPVAADDGKFLEVSVDGVVGLGLPIAYPAPEIATAASITGAATAGLTLDATFAAFTGQALGAQTNEWQSSPDGVSWTDTGDVDETSPVLVAGLRYRMRSERSNSGGAAISVSNVIGPAVEGSAPAPMAAPALSVVGTVITADLAADPADGGAPITGKDVRYRYDEEPWTVLADVPDPVSFDTGRQGEAFEVHSRALNELDADPDNWGVIAEITTEVSQSSNPEVVSRSYQPPNGGVAPTLAVNGNYGGSDLNLDLAAAILPETGPVPTAEQLIAQAGEPNALAYFTLLNFVLGGAPRAITGLPTGVEGGRRIALVVFERSLGGRSAVIIIENVTGLDVTAPFFLSAEVGNVGDDTVRVFFDSDMYGSAAPGDFPVAGYTVNAIAFTEGNDFADLTLDSAVPFGADLSDVLSYTGSGLADIAGNPLAPFADQDITNNVAGAAGPKFAVIPTEISNANTSTPSFTIDLSGALAGDRIYIGYGNRQASNGMTLNGAPMAPVPGGAINGGTSGRQGQLFEYVMPANGAAGATIEIQNPGSTTQHAIGGVITDMVLTDVDTDAQRDGTMDGQVTPGTSVNRVFGIAIGERDINRFTWGGLVEQQWREEGSPEMNTSIATAENVPAAALAVTATSTGSGSQTDMVLLVGCLEVAP